MLGVLFYRWYLIIEQDEGVKQIPVSSRGGWVKIHDLLRYFFLNALHSDFTRRIGVREVAAYVRRFVAEVYSVFSINLLKPSGNFTYRQV
jgi:hypothetical protein